MAAEIGVAQQAVHLLEHGKSTPNLRRLEKIASYLGADVADLLGTKSGEPEVLTNKRKNLSALDLELLKAFSEISDLLGKRLVIQVAKRMRSTP